MYNLCSFESKETKKEVMTKVSTAIWCILSDNDRMLFTLNIELFYWQKLNYKTAVLFAETERRGIV